MSSLYSSVIGVPVAIPVCTINNNRHEYVVVVVDDQQLPGCVWHVPLRFGSAVLLLRRPDMRAGGCCCTQHHVLHRLRGCDHDPISPSNMLPSAGRGHTDKCAAKHISHDIGQQCSCSASTHHRRRSSQCQGWVQLQSGLDSELALCPKVLPAVNNTTGNKLQADEDSLHDHTY